MAIFGGTCKPSSVRRCLKSPVRCSCRYPAISNVQYRLSEADGGTLIKFHHAALGLIPEELRKNVSTGWSGLQERIRARAEGGRA